MANKLEIYQRITHRYNLGWSGEDQWSHLATAKILPTVRIKDETDDYGSHDMVNYVSVPASLERKIGRKALIRALDETMTYSHCRHEHDCCGCATGRARAKRVKSGTYRVVTHISYNI